MRLELGGPTPESIERAKAAQAAERREVQRATGLRMGPDGRFIFPAFRMHCPRPGCQFVASSRTDGRAVRMLSAHLVAAHKEES